MIEKSKKKTWIPLPKSMWSEYIYANICVEYLYRHPTRKIKNMERILLLMQIDSLKEHGEVLFYNEIYILGHDIYIAYLSDLLVVMPIDTCCEGANNGYLNYDIIDRLRLNYTKYCSMSDKELKRQVINAVEENDLLQINYCLSKIEMNNNRKKSRLYARELTHVFKALIKRFLGFICLTISGIELLDILLLLLNYEKGKFEVTAVMFSISLPLIIVWVMWNIKWATPTQFELKNGFINDEI